MYPKQTLQFHHACQMHPPGLLHLVWKQYTHILVSALFYNNRNTSHSNLSNISHSGTDRSHFLCMETEIPKENCWCPNGIELGSHLWKVRMLTTEPSWQLTVKQVNYKLMQALSILFLKIISKLEDQGQMNEGHSHMKVKLTWMKVKVTWMKVKGTWMKVVAWMKVKVTLLYNNTQHWSHYTSINIKK